MANEPEALKATSAAKPEIAEQPSFLRDIRNGLIGVLKNDLPAFAKKMWEVPAARGYIATLIVRGLVTIGLPAGLGTVVTLVIDGLAQ